MTVASPRCVRHDHHGQSSRAPRGRPAGLTALEIALTAICRVLASQARRDGGTAWCRNDGGGTTAAKRECRGCGDAVKSSHPLLRSRSAFSADALERLAVGLAVHELAVRPTLDPPPGGGVEGLGPLSDGPTPGPISIRAILSHPLPPPFTQIGLHNSTNMVCCKPRERASGRCPYAGIWGTG